MTQFVRVELENGALATVAAAVAEMAGLEPLDPETHPAVDHRGRPRPVEYPEAAPEADTNIAPASPERTERRADSDKLAQAGTADGRVVDLGTDDNHTAGS